MKILLDTNAYSHLFRGDGRVMDEVENSSIIYLSVFVIGELLDGFRGGRMAKRNAELLNRFLSRPSVYELQTSRRTAEIYSKLKGMLRDKGNPIPINDVWIAAHALEVNAKLITYDKHFGYIEGLDVWDV